MNATDALLFLVCLWLSFKTLQGSRSRMKLSKLRGPPASSFLSGVSYEITEKGSAVAFEKWEKEYGSVFQVPLALGSREIVIFDPKALSHFFSKDASVYAHPAPMKRRIESMFGRGLMWAEGESHRRQRRVLNPLFSNISIRALTPIFYDAVHKVKTAWDSSFRSTLSNEVIIDVSVWMNRFSLDSVGIAAFGHDFGALDGKDVVIPKIIDALGSSRPSGFASLIPLLSPVLPFLDNIPTKGTRLIKQLHDTLGIIAHEILDSQRNGDPHLEKSIIGSLLKAEDAEAISNSEVLSQMKVLLQAGYETTAISLTWALIELARNPKMQDTLRQELLSFSNSDPTHDQLSNTEALPYLAAITQEVLRLYPPVGQIAREASQDDIMSLSSPIVDTSGKTLEFLTIAKGTTINIPLRCINLSYAIWGADAKDFVPERWLQNEKGIPPRAKEIQGYHHLLTFMDGPRMCLGRNFAVAEIKAVLAVLIRNYVFEMRDGRDTKIGKVVNLFARPKVMGEDGYAMPMRVRQYDL